MRPDAQTALADAPVAERFFDGFEERFVASQAGDIFCRIAGEGPPLLLLHGYPQNSAMWHAVAPDLAQDFTVICPDLRGYGRSHKPVTDARHAPYSKRAMAQDMVDVMQALGHARFCVGAHDRGGRVGHRMAVDHPDRVQALAVLDIAPTREMYREGDSAFAQSYWHWYWLTQPQPLPEMMIGADSDAYWLLKCGEDAAGMTPFVRQALEEYLTAFADPAAIHASCEDYRAAYTIDIAHDDAEAGPMKVPMLALWGADGAIERHFDCLALWRERALHVEGRAIPGGHYLAEQHPQAVTRAFRAFFEEV